MTENESLHDGNTNTATVEDRRPEYPKDELDSGVNSLVLFLAFVASAVGLVVTSLLSIWPEGVEIPERVTVSIVGVFFVVVKWIQDLGIPYWVGGTLQAAGEVTLLLAFMRALRDRPHPYTLPIAAMTLLTTVPFIWVLLTDSSIMDTVPFACQMAAFVLQFVIGHRLTKTYSGSLDGIGALMLLCAVGEAILFAAPVVSVLLFDEDTSFFVTLVSSILYVIVAGLYYFSLMGSLLPSYGEGENAPSEAEEPPDTSNEPSPKNTSSINN